MKNLTLIQDFRKNYNQSFLDLPGLITKRFQQFTSLAQELETELHKYGSRTKGKTNEK